MSVNFYGGTKIASEIMKSISRIWYNLCISHWFADHAMSSHVCEPIWREYRTILRLNDQTICGPEITSLLITYGYKILHALSLYFVSFVVLKLSLSHYIVRTTNIK
jgi:hypothetical protein